MEKDTATVAVEPEGGLPEGGLPAGGFPAGSSPAGEQAAGQAGKKPKRSPEWWMENKKRYAMMPNGIVFIPAGGREGVAFSRALLDLNRHVKNLNNNAIFGDILEIKKEHDEITRLKEGIWEEIKDIIPRFHAFDAKNWQELNENMEERLRLVQRRLACALAPTDDNVAAIAVAVKVLSEKFFEYQAKSDFGKIQRVAGLLKKIREDIEAITKNKVKKPV